MRYLDLIERKKLWDYPFNSREHFVLPLKVFSIHRIIMMVKRIWGMLVPLSEREGGSKLRQAMASMPNMSAALLRHLLLVDPGMNLFTSHKRRHALLLLGKTLFLVNQSCLWHRKTTTTTTSKLVGQIYIPHICQGRKFCLPGVSFSRLYNFTHCV